MQFATPNGLKSAVGTKNARYHIVCIHAAAVQAELYRKVLVDIWANRTPQQAFNFLSNPDVKVTNESDKHSQLPKIKALNKPVQDAFQSVDAQLQQRVAASAEAAARAKAELEAFERDKGEKAGDDDPLRKAAMRVCPRFCRCRVAIRPAAWSSSATHIMPAANSGSQNITVGVPLSCRISASSQGSDDGSTTTASCACTARVRISLQ
jgi:hypothetical protein